MRIGIFASIFTVMSAPGFAQQLTTESLNFVAPSVVDHTVLNNVQIGEIVYDVTQQRFYGADSSSSGWQAFGGSGLSLTDGGSGAQTLTSVGGDVYVFTPNSPIDITFDNSFISGRFITIRNDGSANISLKHTGSGSVIATIQPSTTFQALCRATSASTCQAPGEWTDFSGGGTVATASAQGIVSTAAQSFAGAKTFTGGVKTDTLGSVTANKGVGITGVTDGSTAAAGQVGEYQESVSVSSTSVGAGYNDCAPSLTLTAGAWDIQGKVRFNPAATTSITRLFAGIGTASGNSNSGLSIKNTNSTYMSATVPGDERDQITPTWRVNISGSTTYYLKGYSDFTVSTMTCQGFLRATRVY